MNPAVPPDALGLELERLPGVLAATVFNSPRTGTRVYLAVHDDADRNGIRATTLALLRDHGLHPDPEHIHVGTAPSNPPAPVALPGLSLDSLDIHRADNRAECTVRLRTAGRTIAGTAVEPDSAAGRARAAARATLAAAEAVDPELRLGLHGAQRAELFGFPVLDVLVEAYLGRTHVLLPGTALIERSVEHAGAFATLHALRSWTA